MAIDTVSTSRKEITLREFLDAIEENGFKQTFGQLIEYKGEATREKFLGYDKYQIEGACALGQGMINLNLYRVSSDGLVGEALQTLMRMNDVEHKTIQEIVDFAREKYADILDGTFLGWTDPLAGYGAFNSPRPV